MKKVPFVSQVSRGSF